MCPDYPENIKDGWSDVATNTMQCTLYGNVEPSFTPVNPEEYSVEQEKDEQNEYWYGLDADKFNED